MGFFQRNKGQSTSMLESEIEASGEVYGENLNVTDAVLHKYWSEGVDWKQLHMTFSRREASIPSYGVEPYWIKEHGALVPLTVLCFQGTAKRLDHARRRDTTVETLVLLVNDQESDKVASAVNQVLESRYPGGQGFPF